MVNWVNVRFLALSCSLAMDGISSLLVFGSGISSFVVAITALQNLWKKSDLPLLFHGLVPREGNAIRELDDYYDMKEKALEMRVKLANDSYGHLRFVETGQPEMVMRN